MDRRSFIAGAIGAVGATLVPRAVAAAPLSVAVDARGDVDRIDFEVAVGNGGQPAVGDTTVELALDPDVYIDPERFYRLLDIDATPTAVLSFRPGLDGLPSSARPILTWSDVVPLATGATRIYRASIAIANVHPHRYGLRATVATGSPRQVIATSNPMTHDRSLGALFAAAAQRLAEGRMARSWGPYQFLPLRGAQVGLSTAPGWPSVVVAVAASKLAGVGAVDLARVDSADAPPSPGLFYRVVSERGDLVAMFADPAVLAPAPTAADLAARLVAARPDLLYHEPPQVVGLMLPGTRGGRFGLSRDAQLSGFAATLFLNATQLVAMGALSPGVGGGPDGGDIRLERAAGGWWLTVLAALDEGGG